MIRTKDIIKLAGAVVIIAVSVILFIYPAVIIAAVMMDRELRTTGQSRFVPGWFESVTGRYNSWAQEYLDSEYAAPLTMEAVACSWPTPFGYLLPGLMGKMGADSWCLGEIALLFSMTRPTYVPEVIPFTGSAPGIVWILLVAYAVIGVFFISVEVHYCIKLLRGRLLGK